MTLLRVENLVVRYPGAATPAVAGVSFELPARGSLALVGESGSGKSTTVLAATRLLDPGVSVEADEVMFAGNDLLSLPKRRLRELRREQLAMVFQDPTANWNPTRTLAAQVLDGLRGEQRRRRRVQVVDFMQRVGIPDPGRRLDDYPHHFSGGMLQRTMLAAGLAHAPSLLIADEPTSALDATVQAELLAVIDQLRAEEGLTLLLISHDLGVVSRVATETLVLFAGKVVERGATEAILRRPQHPYTMDLLAAIPRLRGSRKSALQVGRAGDVSPAGCPYARRCVFAVDRCRAETPALRPVEGVDVACHLAPVARTEAA